MADEPNGIEEPVVQDTPQDVDVTEEPVEGQEEQVEEAAAPTLEQLQEQLAKAQERIAEKDAMISRQGNEIGQYRAAQTKPAEAPAAPVVDKEAADVARIMPSAQMEYNRLVGIGYEAGPETQKMAWDFAYQQDAYMQQAIDARVQAVVSPLQSMLAPQVFAADVSAVLAQSPVHGVTADELTAIVQQQSGITLQQWQGASPEERSTFILAAGKQLAYDKFVAGTLPNPAAPKRTTATPATPAVGAPGVGAPAPSHFSAEERGWVEQMKASGLSDEQAQARIREYRKGGTV